MNSAFELLLKLRRSNMSYTDRMSSEHPKVPRTLYPLATEEVYAEEIKKLQKAFVQEVFGVLERHLPYMVNHTDSQYRKDTLEEENEEMQKELDAVLIAIFGEILRDRPAIAQTLSSTSDKIRRFLTGQISQQLLTVAGTALSVEVPNWATIRGEWEATNYTFIKGLAQEYITKLNTLILTGTQAGWSQEELAEAIAKLSTKITGYRAALIARDQVGTLNNKISKAIHNSLGLTVYTWVTARDERVRGNPRGKYPKAIPSHWAMDGMLCRWDDSTVYSDDRGKTWKKRTAIMPKVEPGIEVACRCVAGIEFSPLIKKIDTSIRGGD